MYVVGLLIVLLFGVLYYWCYYFFIVIYVLFLFFFFSSRRRHTRSYGDWSSDVCSSDLFQQYDQLIRAIAKEHDLDPMLVKAVIWRESRFDPRKYGGAGERGLMQVSEKAAKEWARQNKIANFRVDQLFDPKTNLEAGTWYLRRAFEHWETQSDPLPFALAEYNAGASRAQRWSGGAGVADIPVRKFLQNIDFPGTRKYVDSIIARYQFYHRRGHM